MNQLQLSHSPNFDGPNLSVWIPNFSLFCLPFLAKIKRRSHAPISEIDAIPKRRTRRSVSTEKNVEMLMVADQTMYQFYKDGLEEYLLTIANMVCYYLL